LGPRASENFEGKSKNPQFEQRRRISPNPFSTCPIGAGTLILDKEEMIQERNMLKGAETKKHPLFQASWKRFRKKPQIILRPRDRKV